MTTESSDATPTSDPSTMAPEDFDALDDILDELRSRDDEVPQWEFCDGFLAALVCTRRPVPPEEYLPVLLGDGALPPSADAPLSAGTGPFADAIQQHRFFELWQRRWDETALALDTEVDRLDDPRAYQPEVLDMRGAIAGLPEEERAKMQAEDIPSFAQVWALGFMAAVEGWAEDWQPPRDKEAASWLTEALDTLAELAEDDTGKPEVAVFDEDGPPTVSNDRLDAFGDAVWAVYDLRRLWKSLGPRVETLRKAAEPGRNDPCHCGSGLKYKKCHGQ